MNANERASEPTPFEYHVDLATGELTTRPIGRSPVVIVNIPANLWISANDHPGAVGFSISGEPVSKSRARFTGYGSKARAYTPEKTKAAEAAVAIAFKQAGGKFEPDSEVTFGVVATFYNGTRQRRDVDNMLKLILDGLNGVAWVDDTQVMEVAGRKEFTDKGAARTEVAIYPVGRMDRLTKVCVECGVEFITYKSWGDKKHCSEDCMLRKRRLARRRTCQHCGVEWDPGKPSEAKYCSRACQTASAWKRIPCDACGIEMDRRRCHIKAGNYCSSKCRDAANREARAARMQGICADCGGPTSDKNKALRCLACHAATRTSKET